MKQFLVCALVGALIGSVTQPVLGAESAKPKAPFSSFIARFRAAIVARDRAAVAAMSRTPMTEDGKPMSAAEATEYFAPFFGKLRLCVLQERPVPDGDSYSIFCGDQGLLFEAVDGEYKFSEYFAND